MIQPIVVGVDGSEHSLLALSWAIDEALLRNAPLEIVVAPTWYRPIVAPAAMVVVPDMTDLPETGEVLADATRRVVERAPMLEVRTTSTGEPPGRALVERSRHATEIVVGSRGLGGFEGLLLGSVSLYVAGHAACPVVVLSAGPEAGRGPEESPHVLLGVNGRTPATTAIAYAFDQASRRGWSLHVLHAWTRAEALGPGAVLYPSYPSAAAADDEARLLSEVLAGWQEKYPEIHVVRRVVHEPAYQALVDLSAHADLLVVGADRRHHAAWVSLGRVNHAVLHHARCPVAVVPE